MRAKDEMNIFLDRFFKRIEISVSYVYFFYSFVSPKNTKRKF